MKVDRSRSLWPTVAIAGAAALLSLYDVSARHAFAFEACAHCAATPGAIEVKDQTTAPRVEIREWPTPTRGTHPHDPLATPDGAIWYTGQKANLLGRLDPATGQVREFPLKEPDSGPHGLVADKSGAIWFTAQAKGYIGKLDPASGEVREYIPKERGAHRSSYADLRQERRVVVHRASRQSDWTPRSRKRRVRLAFAADEGLGALRHRIWRGRRALCRRIRRE